MDEDPPGDWPTAIFRRLHPAEAGPVRRLLGLDDAEGGPVFVLVDGPEPAALTARAGVAITIRHDVWLVRAAYWIEDPSVADRVGRDLLAEAVRAGAEAVVVPAGSSAACRAILGSDRGAYRGDSLVAEL